MCRDANGNAEITCEEWGVEVKRRIRRKRRMPGELAPNSGLSLEEEVVNEMCCRSFPTISKNPIH
jgi:hypothetical protein